MRIKELNQLDFSSVLFDTLFGLVLFFSLDSFLEINNPLNFLLYLFSLVILIHWWLLFKSADDAFNTEVTNSVTDILVGIAEVILLEFIVLFSKSLDIKAVLYFTTTLILIDVSWAILWRFVGEWKTNKRSLIINMEKELNNTIKADSLSLTLLLIFMALLPLLSTSTAIFLFIGFYTVYIVATFKLKIIDIKFY